MIENLHVSHNIKKGRPMKLISKESLAKFKGEILPCINDNNTQTHKHTHKFKKEIDEAIQYQKRYSTNNYKNT